MLNSTAKRTANKELSISFRMANPDNQVELENLTELFASVYQDSFPRDGVYNAKFWSRHLNNDLKSILIYGTDNNDNEQLLGHIALKTDKLIRKHIQLTLPAFSEQLENYKDEVSAIIKETCEKSAKRQGWELIYCFLFNKCKIWHEISENALGLQEMAICPSYIVNGKNDKQDVIIAVKCFNKTIDNSLSETNIYLPKQHDNMCKDLYKPLNLSRKFKASTNSSLANTIYAEDRAIESNFFCKASVVHNFINPFMVNDKETLINKLNSHKANSNYVFINLFDAECPDFCNELEKKGFRFCGILPLYKGKDSIVYFRGDTKELSLKENMPGKKSTAMATYISSYQMLDDVA